MYIVQNIKGVYAMLQASILTPPHIAGVMDELHESLEQAALQGPNGGACIGIAWKEPEKDLIILCVRTFGDPKNWACAFDELTKLKVRLSSSTLISTRIALQKTLRQLCPEYRTLHPGALVFNRSLIVASSGYGPKNETFSEIIGERIGSFTPFNLSQQPLRVVATG